MYQEIAEKYQKLQGMTTANYLNKSIECHESLIKEMTKLNSYDFDKRYIKRILGKNWEIESFEARIFTIKDDKGTELKLEYDNEGNLAIDTLSLLAYSPIFFKEDGSFIDELKAIINLWENRCDIQEFLCKFIKTIEPMCESVRILKTALQ